VASLISLALVGPSGITRYVDYLIRMGRDSSAQVSALYQIDPRTMPTIRGLCFIANIPYLYVPIAALVLGSAWKIMRSGSVPQEKYASAICVALLVSLHSLMHDLTLLSVPVALFLEVLDWRSVAMLSPFYCLPLCVIFYPHSQALLALPMLGIAGRSYWSQISRKTLRLPPFP
jgi:hypothetical protein